MDNTDINSLFGTLMSDLGDFLVAALPGILEVLAALIGIFFLVKLTNKWIGSSLNTSDENWLEWMDSDEGKAFIKKHKKDIYKDYV